MGLKLSSLRECPFLNIGIILNFFACAENVTYIVRLYALFFYFVSIHNNIWWDFYCKIDQAIM